MTTSHWTAGVYLAGGQSLTEPMVGALQDMRDVTVEQRERIRVLAQFEPDQKRPRMFAFDDAVSSRIQNLAAPAQKAASAPPALSTFEFVVDEPPPGNGRPSAVSRLNRFIDATRSISENGHVFLAVSGHGNGAVGEFLGCRDTDYALGLSDMRETFGSSIREPGKIDIVGLDCCNMSMAEVAFELQPYARYLVASEGYVPNHGWPYRQILKALGGLAPEQAARRVAIEYARFFRDYSLLDVPSHCAVTDLEGMGSLVQAVRGLAEVLLPAISEPSVWRPVVLAHWEAQSYKNEEYVDLGDFCACLERVTEHDEIRRQCTRVLQAVEEVVVANYCNGARFQYSTGLSIYFPWCNDFVKARAEGKAVSVLDKYKTLSFSQATLWGEFIDECLLATRRAPRRAPSPEWAEPVMTADVHAVGAR